MLTHYGEMCHEGKFILPRQSREDCISALAILGITLFKLNRSKEVFMKDPAFLIGRFLGLSDILHKNYCEVVRDGNVPPQLAGNSLLAVADSNAQRAFAICKDRLRPYCAWAETVNPAKVKAGKNARFAKWALKEMKQTATQLSGRLPATPLNDAQKAELFLGYLAWIEDESNSDDDDKGKKNG